MSTHASTELIWVDCPDCLNASRPARRRCKAKGGMCKGLGQVQKWVPIQPAMSTHAPTTGTGIEIDYEKLAKQGCAGYYGMTVVSDLFEHIWGSDVPQEGWADAARAVVAALRDQGFSVVRTDAVNRIAKGTAHLNTMIEKRAERCPCLVHNDPCTDLSDLMHPIIAIEGGLAALVAAPGSTGGTDE